MNKATLLHLLPATVFWGANVCYAQHPAGAYESKVVTVNGKTFVTQGKPSVRWPADLAACTSPVVKINQDAMRLLNFESSLPVNKIDIYDLNGRVVLTANIDNAKTAQVDPRQLSAGMYIAHVWLAGRSPQVTRKVMIN